MSEYEYEDEYYEDEDDLEERLELIEQIIAASAEAEYDDDDEDLSHEELVEFAELHVDAIEAHLGRELSGKEVGFVVNDLNAGKEFADVNRLHVDLNDADSRRNYMAERMADGAAEQQEIDDANEWAQSTTLGSGE